MPDRSFSDPSHSDHEEFIRSRPAEGMLLTPDGRRVAALPEALIEVLHRGLNEPGSSHLPQLLYRAGYEWGLQDMLQLSARLREESGGTEPRDLWKMDAPFVLERWAAPFAAAGWGACIFDLSAHAKGITLVELRHSAAAAACREPIKSAADRATATAHREPVEPACHLYAGLFAGALSFYDRVESHAVETECAALGHGCCRFIIGPGPIIDQAESARHTGVGHDAICRLVLEARTPPAPPAPAAPSAPPPPAPAAAPAKAAKIPWKK